MRSTTPRTADRTRPSLRKSAQNPEAPHILAGRLNTGWIMIDRETAPARKERLENHWTKLLRSYEDACDRTAVVSERGAA